MRMRARRGTATVSGCVAVVASGLASGCYSKTAVPPAEFISLSRPLPRPATVAGSARLGPRTQVRVRFDDGSTSPWLPASRIAIAADGLVTGRAHHGLAEAHEVVIAGADPAARDILAATAPPGAEATPAQDRLRLHVEDRRWLLPWIAAYLDGAAALGRDAGTVSFKGPWWESAPIPGADLARLSPERLAQLHLAEGVPWRDVDAVELNNLDPWQTTGAIVALPIAAAFTLIVEGLGHGDAPTGRLLDGVVDAQLQMAVSDRQTEALEGYGPGDLPAPLRRYHSPAVLVDGGARSEAVEAAPLFTPGALRRDELKVILGGDFGIESKDATFTGSVGAGLRLFDFLEITGRLRSVTFDDRSAAGTGPVVNAGAAGAGAAGGAVGDGPALARHLLGGARLSLHLDSDGNPLTAFVVGGEILTGSTVTGGTLTEIGFVLGPRFGIGEKTFASLLFEPSLLASSNTGTADHTRGRVMFCAELGFDL